MMSVKDVIKKSVYESLGGGTGLSTASIIQILLISCILGIYIYYIYKTTSKVAFYSKDLNITMAGMVVIVAGMMVAMQSNLIVSLGMVGALSIVRFRNAVKNPMDLLYLFWAVSVGIITGVGLYGLAILLCVVMTGMILILEVMPQAKAPALLVVRMVETKSDLSSVFALIKGNSKYYKEKSRNIKNGEMEIIVELKSIKVESLLEGLRKEKGVIEVNYLAFDGESRI